MLAIHHLKPAVFNLLAISLCLQFISCSKESPSPSETVNFLNENGESITIELVDGLVQPFHSFESIEDVDAYLENLENSSTLKINKQIWETLSHYCQPAEIALLSSDDYSMKFEDKIIRYDSEGMYELQPSGDWKLKIFVGKSGNVHKEELRLIIENLHSLDNLANYEFQSPKAVELYNNVKAIKENEIEGKRVSYIFEPGETMSEGQSVVTLRNLSGEHTYLTNNENEAVTYSYTYSSVTYQAIVSIIYVNYEYRIGLSSYAAGATTVFIKDKTTNGIIGQEWQYAGNEPWINIGLPDVYIKVYGKDNHAKEKLVERGFRAYLDYAPRTSGRDVKSRHVLKFRNSNSLPSFEIMDFEWR